MFGLSRRVLIAAGAAAFIGVAAAGTVALASTPTPTAGRGSGQDYRQVFISKLAAGLGIDQSKLTGAVKQASVATIDEAVAKGDLTKDQADKLKARMEQGGPGFFGAPPIGPGPRGDRHAPPFGGPGMKDDAVTKAIADKLGLTADELHTQLRAGKTLAELATAKGLTEQDLKTAAVAAMKTQLDEAVKAGKLTQAQADEMLKRFQESPLPGGGRPMRGGKR